MGDWADIKSREWLSGHYEGRGWDAVDANSLAALLREVKDCLECRKGERARVLAEVRRVLEENAADILDVALGYPSDAPRDPLELYQREAAGARSAIACLEKIK